MLLLLLACAGAPEEEPERFFSPDAPGPWQVGTQQVTAAGPDGLPLPLQIWFPAARVGTSYALYDGLVEAGAFSASTADCAEPRPVLMFSHGNGGLRYQSWFFTERLASHGYVVAAPDHVGNTTFDSSVPHEELILRRPRDIAMSFDAVVALSEDPAGVLAGCVDPDAGYALSGHSFGGYTTLATSGSVLDVAASAAHCASQGGWLCEDLAAWAEDHPGERGPDLSDPRVWAALPQAPAGYAILLGGLGEVEVPTLVLSGIEDTLVSWEGAVVPIFEELGATPRLLAGLHGTGHYAVSNACELAPGLGDCGEQVLDQAEVYDLVNTLSLAFLSKVRGWDEADAWLPVDSDDLTWDQR